MFEAFVKKITTEMSESEIRQVIHSERADFNKGIRVLSDRVKSGESVNEVMADVQESVPSRLFVKIVAEALQDATVSFVESEYVRKLELPQFKECIQYALDNIIIHKESELDAARHLHIDRTQFGYLVKFMNTVNDLVIVKRYTRNNFSKAMYDLFRLEAERIDYIWELFEQNRDALITAALLGAITSIRRANNNIDFLNELLSNLGEE